MDLSKENKKTYRAVDIAKFFFCICVIVTHTSCLSVVPEIPRTIINALIIRMAVPFYFISSGYFLYQNMERRGDAVSVRRYIFRMVRPLIVFESVGVLINVVYMMRDGSSASDILVQNIQDILFYPRVSMWFLQACIVAALLTFFTRNLDIRLRLLIGGVLFLFALLCNNYYFVSVRIGLGPAVDTFLRLFISARNGLFYGYFFMTIGGYIQRKGINRPVLPEILIFTALNIAEGLYVHSQATVDDGSLFISQIFLTAFVFIELLHISEVRPDICGAKTSLVLRKYSSGIYYVQKIMLYCVEFAMIVTGISLGTPLVFLIVLLCSAGAVFLMLRTPYLKDII